MISKIVDALNKRSDLIGWTVRHIRTRESQVYLVPKGIESERDVNGERYVIDVLRSTAFPDGSPAVGSGNASLLPGDDIGRAIDQAALVAGLVSNPVYGLPGPSPLPDVSLSDERLKSNASSVMRELMDRMQEAAARYREARLTAGESYGELRHTHLINSRGLDAEQESTEVEVEFVLHGSRDGRDSESFHSISRRRIDDLNLEAVMQDQARYTLDLLRAEAPSSWEGPVVLRGDALTNFLAGDNLSGSVMQTLASGSAKYAQYSPWEIGKSVFRGEVKGDPLTVWANRSMPYGVNSNRFDAEGLAGQRVELIHENILATFSASQRYAEYLKIHATGEFGNIELPAGKTPASDLLKEPYVEIVQFSWFNPDTITGDFATEIRFGYLVQNGRRVPFKGGQLVGNYMDALANVHWSSETAFFGAYHGPHTARFNHMKISGLDA